MGLFSSRRSRRAREEPAVPVELTEELVAQLPARFEATAEALAGGGASVLDTCWVAGVDLADAGSSLAETIDGLRETTQLLGGREPSYAEMRALTVAWSEATLAYLHGLSCADPLTGLSTHAHLRERIRELYRDARRDPRAHALVVTQADAPIGLDKFASTRRLAMMGQAARTVFDGQESIGQVGPSRVVVVAARDDSLAPRVSLLRRILEDRADRVWIEGLPGSDASAVHLLDELARV